MTAPRLPPKITALALRRSAVAVEPSQPQPSESHALIGMHLSKHRLSPAHLSHVYRTWGDGGWVRCLPHDGSKQSRRKARVGGGSTS